MEIDDPAKKNIWSLQNNKRTEAERNLFLPGCPKKSKKNWYWIGFFFGIFGLSYVLTLISQKNITFCFLLDSLCFQSKENKLAHTLYIFSNIILVGFSFFLLIK